MMNKEMIFDLIKEVLTKDSRLVFAFAYGSFVTEESFRDIDIGVYVKDRETNPFMISSEIKTQLSLFAKGKGVNFSADHFDVKVINDAPFTFLNRVFKEGVLLLDNDPNIRTDMVEYVSLKYRECAGILAEASIR